MGPADCSAKAKRAEARARRLRVKQALKRVAYAACFNVSAFFTASSMVPTM